MAVFGSDDFDALAELSRGSGQELVESLERPAVVPPSNDDQLTAAVDALPPQQRAAVAPYHLEDRPTSQVGELLSCSEATVRSHLRRARQRLAELLGEAARPEEVSDVRG